MNCCQPDIEELERDREEHTMPHFYITVCDCGKIFYDGKQIGMLDINPESLLNGDDDVVELTYSKDTCGAQP